MEIKIKWFSQEVLSHLAATGGGFLMDVVEERTTSLLVRTEKK